MQKVLITGGHGDIAKAIVKELDQSEKYKVFAPGKDELNVMEHKSIVRYISSVMPDILINNAGYINPVSIIEDTAENEMKSIGINLQGVFLCTAETLKKNKNAIIINIGSSAAIKAHGEGWSSYCATKAAVVMATECWAKEGIKAICLSPGRTNTKMRARLFLEEKDKLMKAEDFAKVVVKAIKGFYTYGKNINVNLQNIEVEKC